MKNFPNSIFILFFIITASLLHHKSWNKPPTGHHVWSQSDHYALSLGFLDNKFDFLHPKTYALNHEFPPKKELRYPKGITAVDFPILHYSVAGLMYLLGDTSPWVFRLVSLCWSFIALWFLFDTVRKIKGIGIALLLCGFVMFQPIYIYYQNGINISSAAFNTMLIGMCLMVRYLSNGKFNFYFYGVCLMTLAALMRFTQIIPLLALGGMYIVLTLRNRKWDNRILLIVLGVIIVFNYFMYNRYLALNYGSIWLNKPIISDSIGDVFKEVLALGFLYLKFFLPPFHLIILASILILGLKKVRFKLVHSNELLVWILFLFLGASLFTLLTTKQLVIHDYYALDVWMPLLILILLYVTKHLDYNVVYSHKWKRIGILMLICTFSFALFIQEKRYNWDLENSELDTTINSFKKSSVFLNSIIPKNAKVLIMCDGGWNIPMVGWRRDAFRVTRNYSERIPIELSNNYDFIVTYDLSFKKTVLKNYSIYLEKVHKVDGNGLVTVWKQL